MEQQQPNEASSAEAKKRSNAGMSDEKQKKKRNKSEEKRTPRATRIMSKSSFLDTNDMGRLLLRTCKAMTVAGLGDDKDAVWKHLCSSYWGAEKATNLLETLAISPKTCFYRLAVLDDKYIFEGPRPLKYTPLFIISIKEPETGKPILCKTIPGQDVSKFFDDGKATVLFGEPFLEKEFDPNFRGPSPSVSLKWDGSLHIMRRPDERMERFVKYTGGTDCVKIRLDEEGTNGELNAESRAFKINYVEECWGDTRSFPPNVTGRYGQALYEHYGCLHPVGHERCQQRWHLWIWLSVKHVSKGGGIQSRTMSHLG